jgi:hypothetical protein|eukprot:g4811.t1
MAKGGRHGSSVAVPSVRPRACHAWGLSPIYAPGARAPVRGKCAAVIVFVFLCSCASASPPPVSVVSSMWAHERVLVSVEPGAVVADGVPAAHRAHLNKGRFTREMLVSIAYVKFDQGLQVNRNLNSSLLLDDEGFFPESKENSVGLTELACTGGRPAARIPSYDHRQPAENGGAVEEGLAPRRTFFLDERLPLDTFIPAEMLSSNSLMWLAATVARNVFKLNTLSSKEFLGVVFRDPERLNEAAGVGEGAWDNCTVTFLTHAEQGGARLPGQYESVDGAPFFGAVPLETRDPMAYGVLWPVHTEVRQATAAAATSLALFTKFRNDEASGGQRCTPLPHAAKTPEGAAALLETGTYVGFPDEFISDVMPNLLKGSVMALLMPILKLLGVFGGDKLMTPLMDNMSQMTDGGLVGALNEQISPKLILDLNHGIPPGVRAAMPETVTQAIAEMMESYVKRSLLADLYDPVSTRIANSLPRRVPGNTAERVSKSLSSYVLKNAVHTLTRSLTHSIVPSLTHTLTHNPMQDYYCYYCFEHKTYCQYCSYAPSQLYYATFYAGYYSTYFSDYYSGAAPPLVQ